MTAKKNVTLTRREALQSGAALIGAATFSAAALSLASAPPAHAADYGKAPDWLRLLGVSENGGRSYAPRVEGSLPAGLSGTLYRNGPGLFERGEYRRDNLLDGDGLVQSLQIKDGKAYYRNAFVRTPKFLADEAAGKPQYATWTTRAPGGMLSNMGGDKMESQAGVTIYPFGDKVYAFDEMNPGFEIDPVTLETRGSKVMGRDGQRALIKAHTKFDPKTGDWIFAGGQFGPSMKLHTLIYDKVGQVKEQHVFESPRQCYFHDFFASENYIIFLLQPLELSLFSFLGGMKSFTRSLSWDGSQGNLVAVCPKAGGEVRVFEAPASFMWHSLNAFEEKGQLFLDFTGYREPDHFVGEDALLYTIMEGKMGRAKEPGWLRRYRIDLASGKLEETILDKGNHEFAMMDLRGATERQSVGYLSTGGISVLGNGISRFDYRKGTMTHYSFGDTVHAGEAIFAPQPGGGLDEGWLLVQCLDGGTKTSFFAILDASRIEDGPVARVWLDHHVPISFHGAWKAA